MISTSDKPFGTMTMKKSSIENTNYLKKKDKQMRFNNSQDPIYYIFDVIENRPVSTLAREFVRDSFKDTVNFISRVVG